MNPEEIENCTQDKEVRTKSGKHIQNRARLSEKKTSSQKQNEFRVRKCPQSFVVHLGGFTFICNRAIDLRLFQ